MHPVLKLAWAFAGFMAHLFLAEAGRIPQTAPVEYTTRGGVSPEWNIGPLNPVLMDVHNTGNYQLNGSRADAQWAALIPARGGIVRVGPQKELFMVSMYHQLRCLDIIRKDYVEGYSGKSGTSPVTRHCLNYIRQMVLCRGDRRLERVVDPFSEHPVQIRDAYTCRDWTKVYDRTTEYENLA